MSYVKWKQNIQILYHSIFNFCFKNILVTSTVDFSYAEQSTYFKPTQAFSMRLESGVFGLCSGGVLPQQESACLSSHPWL